MNVLTCQQVEEQLDLLAAGECDRSTRRALEEHLESCDACSATYTESKRLQGLLELHWNEAAQLDRLRQRIEDAERTTRRSRSRVFPWTNRAVALAALLLVMFGLALLLPRGGEEYPASDLTITGVMMSSSRGFAPELKMEGPLAPARVVADAAVAPLDKEGIRVRLQKGECGKAYQDQLVRLQSVGQLPLPPSMPLGLQLKNNIKTPLEIRFADKLLLDVQGPGVLRLRASGNAEPGFLAPPTIRLAPGSPYWLPVGRLIAGARPQFEYVYLTEPGEYKVTMHLGVRVNGQPRLISSETIRIQVLGE